jgi:hypothetical protein
VNPSTKTSAALAPYQATERERGVGSSPSAGRSRPSFRLRWSRTLQGLVLTRPISRQLSASSMQRSSLA